MCHRQPVMCFVWETMSTSRRPTTPSSATTAAGRETSSASPMWPKLQNLRKVPLRDLWGACRAPHACGLGEKGAFTTPPESCHKKLGVMASISLQGSPLKINTRPVPHTQLTCTWIFLPPAARRHYPETVLLCSAQLDLPSFLHYPQPSPNPPNFFYFISSPHSRGQCKCEERVRRSWRLCTGHALTPSQGDCHCSHRRSIQCPQKAGLGCSTPQPSEPSEP